MLIGGKQAICRLACFLIENIFSYTQVVSNIEINCLATNFRSESRFSGRHFKKLAYHYLFVFVIGRQIKAFYQTKNQSLSLDDKLSSSFDDQSLLLDNKSKPITGRRIKDYHWRQIKACHWTINHPFFSVVLIGNYRRYILYLM